jgi:hypothetical protein
VRLRRAFIGASLLLMQAAPTAAHEGVPPDIRVILDGVEPPVAGLRVQVYDDNLAPQLVLENQTGQPLEILDEQGRAFLRVGASGVDADLGSVAWYLSVSPGGAPVPENARAADSAPQWRHVRAEPSWGWFDPRLDAATLRLPQAKDPVVLAHWTVPARLGAQELQIRGHFLYRPQPPGLFLARMTSAPELAPGVRVTLAPGQPPALMLENAGGPPVVVLGKLGEPFLRIAPDGVEANVASASWQDLGRYRGWPEAVATPAHASGPVWKRVSLAPRYLWLEPRAGMPSLRIDAAAPRAKVKGWEVPVRIGPRQTAIQGVIEWVPATVAARK